MAACATAQNTKTQQPTLAVATLPPAASSSTSMGRSEVPPTHGTAAPKIPTQGVRRRVCAWSGWFPCLGSQTDTHRKIERWGGRWLRWSPLSRNKQQSSESQRPLNKEFLGRGAAGVECVEGRRTIKLGDDSKGGNETKNNTPWV